MAEDQPPYPIDHPEDIEEAAKLWSDPAYIERSEGDEEYRRFLVEERVAQIKVESQPANEEFRILWQHKKNAREAYEDYKHGRRPEA